MFHLIRAIAGSKLYGTNTHGSDDDCMGIFVAGKEEKLGLSCRAQIVESPDSTMYELSKYVRLAAGGNPTILQLLFTPEPMWVQWTEEWSGIQSTMRTLCVSQKCRPAFLGYLQQQKKKMLDGRQQRPELVEKYGFDTKFAMHAIRLGMMGHELLLTGKILLPMHPEIRQYLLSVRNGKDTQVACLSMIEAYEHSLQTMKSVLPLEPDYDKINQWLSKTYLDMWGMK